MSPVVSLEVSVVRSSISSAKQYCCGRGMLHPQHQEVRTRGPGTSLSHRFAGGSAGPLSSPADLSLCLWIEVFLKEQRQPGAHRGSSPPTPRCLAGARAGQGPRQGSVLANGWAGDSSISGQAVERGHIKHAKWGESSWGWSSALLPLIFSRRKVRMATRLLVSAMKSG